VYARSTLMLVLASLAGCMSSARLQVLRPADVMIPPHVERIAVVDRSRPAKVGEGVLGTLEGLAGGRLLGAQRVDWIDAGGSPRGQPGAHDTHGHEHERHGHERRRVERPDLV